jgi:hypothetical protein
MTGNITTIALINILSLLYLAFVLTFVLGVAEHDAVKKIIISSIRRWVKLVGVLFILAVIVHMVSSF